MGMTVCPSQPADAGTCEQSKGTNLELTKRDLDGRPLQGIWPMSELCNKL